MHGYALQKRLQNVGITVSTLHPGYVSCILLNLRIYFEDTY